MPAADRADRDAAERAAALAALDERLEADLAEYDRSAPQRSPREQAQRAADRAAATLADVGQRYGLPTATAVRLEGSLWPDRCVRRQPPPSAAPRP